MKRIALFFLLTLFILTPSAFSQDDDWYRPGGFDAIGRSYKTFSVSDTKKVHFSRGNLQYNAAQNKWRFALRQYNMICSDNANISQTYDGWIDLFCWGTSGWNSGANAYQPWSTSDVTEDYYVGGIATNSLSGEYANADWGVYNKITNGGNKAGQWRTLTKDEWEYLIGRSGKYGMATIGDIYKGLVLLPDDWTLPTGLSFTAGYDNVFATNTYTMAQWQTMESAGAVFLPAAGDRYGTDVNDVGTQGYYWSGTYFNENDAWFLYFLSGFVDMGNGRRNGGLSVRLVADENPNVSKAFDLEGASYKTFSVADGRTVHFSKGNLRYNAATNTWAFAAKQYLYIGDANANIAEDYNGWIDLFSWGTSGWSSGANAYQPWSTNTEGTDYQPGGSGTNNLTGDYAKADWGVYNKITNGGNKAGKWRTLTKEEWQYLLGSSSSRDGKYGLATIGGNHNGLIILPDDWTLPNGLTFTAGYDNGFATNTYTTDQWQKMEAAGAVFLPTAGYRDGYSISGGETYGYYWSSSYNNDMIACNEGFSSDNVSMRYNNRYFGFAVRLVKD